MELLFLLGRLLFGGYFVLSGINHFSKFEGMVGYAKSKNVPLPETSVAVSGLAIILGGLGILLGMYVPWSVGLIVLFLLAVSFKMHNFWAVSDPQMKMGDTVNFLKNMALIGAALLTLSIPGF